MTGPVDPFGGPSAEQISESASKVRFGIKFSGTSAADLLLGRVVEEPRMWASPEFGGAAFNRQALILASDIDRLGVDIRSFKTPLRRAVEQVMIPSIAKNFDVGGRPRWEPLAQGTIDNRGSAEPVLVQTGRLRRTAKQKNMWKYNWTSSLNAPSSVEFSEAELKKRVPYGVFHQFGAFNFSDRMSRRILAAGGIPSGDPQWRLPQRMFVTMRPEDQVEIYSIFYQWLVERTDYHYYGFGTKPGRR